MLKLYAFGSSQSPEASYTVEAWAAVMSRDMGHTEDSDWIDGKAAVTKSMMKKKLLCWPEARTVKCTGGMLEAGGLSELVGMPFPPCAGHQWAQSCSKHACNDIQVPRRFDDPRPTMPLPPGCWNGSA